jgi:hypothetical protein
MEYQGVIHAVAFLYPGIDRLHQARPAYCREWDGGIIEPMN